LSRITQNISSKIKTSIEKLNLDVPQFSVEKPREDAHGDYSTNAAMMLAKSAGKNPRLIAASIIDNLGIPDKFISGADIAGPGFINFRVSNEYYKEEVERILKLQTDFGRMDTHKGEKANIEWVSANPTGPLHAGHGRHIALGKAIANLIECQGYELTREYYYNDAGKQMDNLAKSVYTRYRQMFEPSFAFPEDGYVGDYILTIAQLIKDEHGDKLLNEPENQVFKDAGENWCFKSIRHTLERLGIVHDVFYNETSLYESGKIKEALAAFKEKGLSYGKDGATWLKTSELLKDKKDAQDKVIVKATGEPTYRMPDMAYHADKIKHGFDLIVDVFGADHGDTYKEVLAGVQGLGLDISKIKVIIHQMVTFMQDGTTVKMSKRSDNVYYLDDLLDDVGVDVAQFFFVMRSANTHLEFDVNLAKEQSEKNPVFYLQYAHARICGVLRHGEEILPGFKQAAANLDSNLLIQPDEIALMKVLSEFPDAVESAAATYEPHKIITYLNLAAESFHKFYHNNRVINLENPELSYQRLMLCRAAQIVLKNGFHIIGISAPERM